jgi:hypothetical protein
MSGMVDAPVRFLGASAPATMLRRPIDVFWSKAAKALFDNRRQKA